MASEMLATTEPKFEHFNRLPAELRQMIWFYALDEAGNMVTCLPAADPNLYRRKNPAASAVNRESRAAFLRVYEPIHDTSNLAPEHAPACAYLNPRIDSLLLGDYGVPGLTGYAPVCPPKLSEPHAKMIREVRLQQRDLKVFSINRGVGAWTQIACTLHTGPAGLVHECHLRVANLIYPNLDTIWITSSYSRIFFPQNYPGWNRGLTFRYCVRSGEVYVQRIKQEDYEEGLRVYRTPQDPALLSVVRVDIIRNGGFGGGGEGWHRINVVGRYHDLNAVWEFIVHYIDCRLSHLA
ncbi:hypothetical protein CGCSCA4_v010022 [Colletotrichum siamense]|uniref:2EXR domain-containing protein n=1 Tax=Colletotrichum siamense TaxID=690259 RepID=A0A9P5EPX7_COLSI|nr:hypothetical protein CGCSCA4_v010022 [Colletotrichum siamense]KAF4857331.1 hypothetical protein CGCSCA2_v008249 [Colletotrichum siamense]